MAQITMDAVKRLRELTGAGMLDCKNALTEADGDVALAHELLRRRGLEGVTKREGRTASNGLVTAHRSEQFGVLLELNCETDFVAKSDRFRQLAGELLQQVVRTRPADVEALLGQPVAQGAGRPVRELLDEANAALGEKIELRRFAVVDEGHVYSYLHRTSPDLPPTIGVLVALDGPDEELGHDLTQQVAATAPRYLDRVDVPAEVLDSERAIAEQAARAEGRPEQVVPRIVEGRLAGFHRENVLVEQSFVKDAKRTVAALLDAAGRRVLRYVRYRVGQP